MLYVVGLNEFSKTEYVSRTRIFFDNDADEYKRKHPLAPETPCEVYIYNSDNNCISLVSEEKILQLYKSGVKIIGVEYENVYNGLNSLEVCIRRPDFRNLIRFREGIAVLRDYGRLNQYFMQCYGIPDKTYGVIIGDTDDNYKHMYYLSSNKKYISNSGVRNIDNVVKKHKGCVSYIGDVALIKSINIESNSVECFDLSGYAYDDFMIYDINHVLDLYWLAVLNPNLVRNCRITGENEFIIDTLTDRYVFDVADGLRTYFLRCKLSRHPYFCLR